MKKQFNILSASISEETLANLTKEIKETIAFDFLQPKPKCFTVAELWNVQRLVKTRPQRRYL